MLNEEHAARAPTSREQAEDPSWGYPASARGNRGPAVHPGGPSVLERQGGPPGVGTPRPNEPTRGAVAQRRRGTLPQHPAVLLADEHRESAGAPNQEVYRRNRDGLQRTATRRRGGGGTGGGPNYGRGPP